MLDRPFADTETLQLAELHSLAVFYTPLDVRFDRLTRLAQRALGAPVAAIALLNQAKLWFKSVQGWNIHELALDESFCARTLSRDDIFVIEDTRLERDFSNHLLVTGPARFRFYAGHPLRDRAGLPVGTLAVYDLKPRTFTPADMQTLRDLGDLAQRELLTAELANAQAELLAKLDLARRSAMIDALTRVWNRGAAQELLTVAVEQASREDTGLGVIMVDVVRFKDINDTFGHQVGDQVLRRVASTLVSSVREGDSVCRYGGDEFLIILQDTNREELERVTARLAERVSEAPMKARSGVVNVTITTGNALRPLGHSLTSDELVALADQALIRAKQSGRSADRA
jgi:diguanylate cyclase (GGDEF)-like protein